LARMKWKMGLIGGPFSTFFSNLADIFQKHRNAALSLIS
jgi:hypothetical protein